MIISGTQVKTALTKYDSQGSYLGYFVVSEPIEIAQLRQLATQLTEEQLNPKEISSLVHILSLIKVDKDSPVRYKELVQSLQELFGNKLEAFKRLEKNHVLDQYADRIEAHENPGSAARMVTHFLKYKKKQSDFLGDKEIEQLLSDTAPYLQLKTATSTAKALDFLHRAPINHSEATKSTIEKRPVVLAKALKKFEVNSVALTSDQYGLVIHSVKPVEMAAALIKLEHYPSTRNFKNEVIKGAQISNNPDFILACIYLNERKIYTLENIEKLKQSSVPVLSARSIFNEKTQASLNEFSGVGYGLLRVCPEFCVTSHPVTR